MATNNAINNSVKITEYISNDTWVKDSRTKLVTVIGWCGGGGGGSGRQGASTSAGGGAGGSGGTAFYVTYPASFFGASEPVVVGTGGAGGIAQTVNNTDGNPGTAGGVSSFASIIPDNTPTFGAGGSINSVIGGVCEQSLMSIFIDSASAGMFAGNGEVTDGGNATQNNIGNIPFTGAPFNHIAGCGGGGAGADSVTERTGGSGHGIAAFNGTIVSTGAAGGIESGTINGANGSNALTSGGIMTGGLGGGGGGGQSVGTVAGKGGDGGFPGGGGGGGGGSLNGTNSGAGGKGGDGKIIVIEYF